MELFVSLERYGFVCIFRMAMELFALIDANQDGTITKREFIRWYRWYTTNSNHDIGEELSNNFQCLQSHGFLQTFFMK